MNGRCIIISRERFMRWRNVSMEVKRGLSSSNLLTLTYGLDTLTWKEQSGMHALAID